MARRKKTDELEIEVESKEPTEESEATDDAEQLEQEALAEVDADEAALAADSAEDREEKAAKPKRQRRPRKKKEAEPTLMATEPIAPPTLAAASAPVAAATDKPSPGASEVFVANPDHLREDAAVAEVSIHRSMDSMARQWASVKEISTSVCANLERVAGSLNDLETKYATASQELNKQATQKSQLLNRIAVGASAMALVMSLLSLALSQSARQNALNTAAQAKTESAPLKSSFSADAARPVAIPAPPEMRKELPNAIARSSKGKAERKGSVRK